MISIQVKQLTKQFGLFAPGVYTFSDSTHQWTLVPGPYAHGIAFPASPSDEAPLRSPA